MTTGPNADTLVIFGVTGDLARKYLMPALYHLAEREELRSTGIVLGRTTYEMFEPAWSTRTVDDDPGAPFFNDTTKYVVSSTLTAPTWRNTTVLGGYDADVIRNLKEDVGGDLYVSGSATLVRAMLADEAERDNWTDIQRAIDYLIADTFRADLAA